MDFLSKIEKVREHLASWQEEWGDDFRYLIGNFGTENTETRAESIYLGRREHRYIIDYLASKGYLKISDDKGETVRIKILPKARPTIKLKTLELIARDLKDYFTGTDIIALLKEAGVNQELIIYPQSKWLIFYGVFKELALSKDKSDKELLLKVIADVLHPLNLKGNVGLSDELREKFNKYLEYDRRVVIYDEEEKKYVIVRIPTQEEEQEMLNDPAFYQETEEQERAELCFLQKAENKEKISTLRKTYQVFMNIVEVFCDNPSRPSHELNDTYLKTKKLITDAVNDLHLCVSSVDGVRRIHTLTHYCVPFNNLFTAEAEYKNRLLEKLHWDDIRPKMHATYGNIDELYRKVDGSDVLSTPDVQQTLNDVSLFLSKMKEENKKHATEKRRAAISQVPIHKIEITAMPELQMRNIDDAPVIKGKKRLHLPKFNPTDWAKITIRFIDEQNVIITADKKQVSSDYEALGFADDKRGKPNTAWAFLRGLADHSGETQLLPTPIPDTIKQHKRQLSDRLKTIFKNDTDPFYEPKDTRTYKLKLTLIPPHTERETPFERRELLTEDE